MHKVEDFGALAPDQARQIDALFATVDRPDHPGAAVAVMSAGELVHLRCFGLANVEHGIPVTPDTVFRLGSLTKQLTASVVLILENRSLLALDDPVGRYLQGLPAVVAAITLRELLSMRSGLPDGLVLPIFAGMGRSLAVTRDQHLAMMRRQTDLMFAPGTQMLYSNSNYLLLSLVIEHLTGSSLGEVFAREIFVPLGMRSARLTANPLEPVPHKATGYVPARSGSGFETGVFLYEATGEGGVDASIRDMTQWLRQYRGDLLQCGRFRERLEAPVCFPGGRVSPYRLGTTVVDDGGLRRVGHTGGMSGYLADFSFYPELDLGIAILSNWMDPSLLETVARIREVLAPRAIERAAPTLAGGLYFCAPAGLALHLEPRGDGIVCYMMGDRSSLAESSDGVLRPTKPGVDYEIVRGKSDGELEVTFGGARPLPFLCWTEHRAEVPCAAYEGRYRSPVLGEVHLVRAAADGQLEIFLESPLRQLSWRTLLPLARDCFCALIPGEPSLSNLTLQFERDAHERLTGFRYRTFRCRNVLFERLAE